MLFQQASTPISNVSFLSHGLNTKNSGLKDLTPDVFILITPKMSVWKLLHTILSVPSAAAVTTKSRKLREREPILPVITDL
jgi:hypothetical protein